MYECIVNNHQFHALHAAALAYQDRGILQFGSFNGLMNLLQPVLAGKR